MEFLNDTAIWLLGSFIVFLFVVWKAAAGNIAAMLDSRIAQIKQEIETAENLRIEAQELLAQYQRKHRDAMQDAENIISNAKIQAKDIQKKAEADLTETMKRRENQLSERLNRMEENAIAEIQSYAADLAMNAATQIITDKLDKKTSENLVKNSIADISEKLH